VQTPIVLDTRIQEHFVCYIQVINALLVCTVKRYCFHVVFDPMHMGPRVVAKVKVLETLCQVWWP